MSHDCPSCYMSCDCDGGAVRCTHLCLQLADVETESKLLAYDSNSLAVMVRTVEAEMRLWLVSETLQAEPMGFIQRWRVMLADATDFHR